MKKTLQLPNRPAPWRAGRLLMVVAALVATLNGLAQIYEPEGLNMPGAWNSWTNPPTNLALASSTQVTGGRVVKFSSGTPRWQTIFSVAASGGDLAAGTYEWLFTSGPTTNAFQNKWSAVTVVMDSLQLYTKEGSQNNSITLVDGKWYTMNFEDQGYVSTRAIFMQTSGEPAAISAVSVPASVAAGSPATITVTLGTAPAIEENFFVRYSTDAWATSSLLHAILTGSTGSVTIPAQTAGTVVSYYAFSSTRPNITADFDLYTIKMNNNSGANYSYTVGAAAPAITFANLQFPGGGMVGPGNDFFVFGQAYIQGLTGLPTPAAGLQAWVGYSSANTDPATWTDWIPAVYNAPVGNNDEFKANLGAALTAAGTYYYATRFRLNSDPYVYGGYSATGGGFWDGTNNISGILDIEVGIGERYLQGVKIHPNPVGDLLYLELPADASVKILNPVGIPVISCNLTRGTRTIDLSGFAAGMYTLGVIAGDHQAWQKFIKR